LRVLKFISRTRRFLSFLLFPFPPTPVIVTFRKTISNGPRSFFLSFPFFPSRPSLTLLSRAQALAHANYNGANSFATFFFFLPFFFPFPFPPIFYAMIARSFTPQSRREAAIPFSPFFLPSLLGLMLLWDLDASFLPSWPFSCTSVVHRAFPSFGFLFSFFFYPPLPFFPPLCLLFRCARHYSRDKGRPGSGKRSHPPFPPF